MIYSDHVEDPCIPVAIKGVPGVSQNLRGPNYKGIWQEQQNMLTAAGYNDYNVFFYDSFY